jgi:polysaccharide deacetylase 2 family uncharacterized protein YibQ
MVMPVNIEITETDGDTKMIHLPVQVWNRGSTWTIKHDSDSEISKVVIDPENNFPDVDVSNNTWGSSSGEEMMQNSDS